MGDGATAESHRLLVRKREGVRYAAGKAREIAAKAMTEAAWVKNPPGPTGTRAPGLPTGSDPPA